MITTKGNKIVLLNINIDIIEQFHMYAIFIFIQKSLNIDTIPIPVTFYKD